MYVCVCNALRERDVQEAIRAGCRSMAEVHQHLGVETQCGRCEKAMQERADVGAILPAARAA